MNENQTSTRKQFVKKMKNRLFGIETLGASVPKPAEEKVISNDERLNQVFQDNIWAANQVKVIDGYCPIYSVRPKIGKLIVLSKRAIRKLIKIFFGWYLFPIYNQVSHFNGKILNAVNVEHALAETRAVAHQDVINALQTELARLQMESEQMHAKTAQLAAEVERLRSSAQSKKKEFADQLIENIHHDEVLYQAIEKRFIAHFKETIVDGLIEKNVAMDQRISKNAKISENLKVDLEQLSRRQNATMQGQKELEDKLIHTPCNDDDFYHAFEERFRGSREMIAQRLQMYLPHVQKHLPDWTIGKFIDIGSGRGEWLDVLHDKGVRDYVGVDLNEVQNQIAQQFGHPTLTMDAVSYLESLPSESIDMISGFQIVEHLYPNTLLTLLKQCNRVLKNGGLILFETPSISNVLVATKTYYMDFDHKRPMPPELLCYLAEYSGFDVEMIDANSTDKWMGVSLPEKTAEHYALTKEFNEVCWKLYGPQDYAVLGVKKSKESVES